MVKSNHRTGILPSMTDIAMLVKLLLHRQPIDRSIDRFDSYLAPSVAKTDPSFKLLHYVELIAICPKSTDPIHGPFPIKSSETHLFSIAVVHIITPTY
jgi:hypothetical protein